MNPATASFLPHPDSTAASAVTAMTLFMSGLSRYLLLPMSFAITMSAPDSAITPRADLMRAALEMLASALKPTSNASCRISPLTMFMILGALLSLTAISSAAALFIFVPLLTTGV